MEKGRKVAGVYANSEIARNIYLHIDRLKIRGWLDSSRIQFDVVQNSSSMLFYTHVTE